jgi:hypothetical protein
MFNKIYKKIVRFLVETHIAKIDFGSESEVDEFYDWLYSKKSHKKKSSMKNKVIKILACCFGAFAIICLALMLICNQIGENNGNEVGTYSQTTIFSFLGKPIIINDSLCEQIVSIAGQDEMLSYNDSIIKIGEVWWRLNLMPNSIALMTSVQPDDPKMKHVIKYLNGIYGKPYDDHEDGYSIKWSSSGDSLDVFRPGSTLVHLRRVHTEEGGTFLIFK